MTLDELKRLIADATSVVPDGNEDLQLLVNKEAAILILEGIAPDLAAQVVRLTEAEAHQRANKDQAYEERNRLVALLASMFPSGTKRTDIPGWNPEWHGAVYIDFPWGQASWHFHDSQAHLFAHLPPYSGEWDGHTTESKYAAIASAALGDLK